MQREDGNDHFIEKSSEGNVEESGKTTSHKGRDHLNYPGQTGKGAGFCTACFRFNLGSSQALFRYHKGKPFMLFHLHSKNKMISVM